MRSEGHSRFVRRDRRAIACACVVALAIAFTTSVQAQTTGRWIGTWSTAPMALLPPPPAARNLPPSPAFPMPPQISNQTIRQIVHTSIGGSSVRVALTNRFGTAPLRIGAAHVAARGDGSAIAERSGGRLAFRGNPSVTIEAGATVVSDPVAMAVRPLGDVAIDLYLPDDTWGTMSPATYHASSLSTTYVSAKGNHAGTPRLPVEGTFQSWLFLSRVDVSGTTAPGAIVTMGDSITDGTGSTADGNGRWPDVLAQRLVKQYGAAAPAVLNAGIAGNRLLGHNAGMTLLRRAGLQLPNAEQLDDPNALFGPSGLSRLDQDVLLQPGVTHVIVLETINDIGMTTDPASPKVEELIAGHRALIQRAHARGLKVYGATLTPFKGAFYWTEGGEAKRQAVNTWIRTSKEYDAVVDFDAAVRDPNDPARFRADYHPGDWLHANDAGYKAMAGAIDLALLASKGAMSAPARTTTAK